MEPMVRKQLYLTPAQDRALKERARREHRSEADLVRQAVDLLLDDGAKAQAAVDDLQRFLERVDAEHPAEPRASGEGRGWTRDELYDGRLSRWS